MNALAIDGDLVTRTLGGFLADEIGKFGFRRAVVGLSGGVDSSLATCLAAQALGPESVTAILMPYRTSSPESAADAALLVQQLGVAHEVIEITAQVEAYFERFPDADHTRRGNKMARERMTILYDRSVVHGAIVVGTSNKTEALLGYTTLWGDMACGVNPLGDLYKTQVRQLARHVGVPERIVAKNPTADLWPGQTDEGELGFTYADVDQVLFALVDERRSVEELVATGADEAFVGRVYELMRNAQYKRRLPIVAKISHRSLDRDFRYSRDWGR